MKKTQQKVLSGLTVVIFILILTKSETVGFTVNGVEISSNRTCSSNPNITCFVYFIRDQGCSAKAVTAFPHLYHVSENKFPEKPESMVSFPFHTNFSNNKYYPGLTITLKAPATASYEVVKGFELIYSYNLDSNYGCLIFDLSAAKLTYLDVVETDFSADIWPMKKPEPPVVLLVSRSLPPAPAQYDRYLNATENIGEWGKWAVCPSHSNCTGNTTPSCQWVTSIMNKVLTNDSGPFNNIQVSFALAPPEFPFTIYTVRLYKVNGTSSVSTVNVTKDPNVTCFVYFIRDQGCSAKAVTAFPHLYDVSKENKFPEKPQSMVINPFHKKYPSNHKYYPGLTISLKAPDTASFEVLKGFELIYSYNLDSNYGCLIFDLSAAKLTYTDALETDFWANIWPMKVTDAPAVLLVSRSLPPAPAEYDRYLNATENAGTWGEWGVCPANSDCMDNPTPSSQWVTTVMNKALTNYSGHFNQIQVVFALAPPEFSFTIYTISLYNVNDMSPVSAVNVTKDFPSHVFKRISPGTYIVKVLPFDPYLDQGTGRCLCKNENSNCFPCTSTITRDFTVGYNLVSVSDVSSQAVYHHEGNIRLIAAVLGGCFGVLRILFS